MISRVYEVFQIDLPVQILFEKPSVAGLAEHIEAFRMTAQELQVLTDISEKDRKEGFL